MAFDHKALSWIISSVRQESFDGQALRMDFRPHHRFIASLNIGPGFPKQPEGLMAATGSKR
jgi:hypothetical protein